MYLENYQHLQLLGKGGFATVYRGEHRRLRRPVAIKVLNTHLSQRDQALFLQEARTLARLHHANIVRVHFGIENETPYLVMSYLAHGTLRQRYARGQAYPLAQILPHLKQVAEALYYAHERKIVHRDVKPENMLLNDQGEAILSDFGIAVLNQESRMQGRQDIIGTAPYMAPEQIKGYPRRASDQYALAIVAYEWLCGQRPFSGERFEQIVFQHVHTPPPSLLEKVPGLSSTVEAIIFKALAKEPEKRYTTVREFVNALEQVNRTPDRTRPLNTTAGEHLPGQVALVSTAPLLAPTQPMATRQVATEKVSIATPVSRRAYLIAGKMLQSTPLSGPPLFFGAMTMAGCLSPDEKYALSVDQGNQGVVNLETGATHPFSAPIGNLQGSQWSPTGMSFGIMVMKLYIVDAITGQIISQSEVADSVLQGTMAMSPDGQHAAFTNRKAVLISNARTGKTVFTYYGHTDSVVLLAWSPDGKRICSADQSSIQVWQAFAD